MGVILDTNALSAWAKGDESLAEVLASAGQVMLPVIVLGEYRSGLLRSRERVRLEAWLDSIRTNVRVLPVDEDTSVSYAIVRFELHRIGRPISPNDMWIAALALQHEGKVVSRDADFDAVDGVTRIGW